MYWRGYQYKGTLISFQEIECGHLTYNLRKSDPEARVIILLYAQNSYFQLGTIKAIFLQFLLMQYITGTIFDIFLKSICAFLNISVTSYMQVFKQKVKSSNWSTQCQENVK